MTEREIEIEAVLRAVLLVHSASGSTGLILVPLEEVVPAMARAVVEQIVELERKRDDLQATLDEIHTAIPATFYAGLGVPTFRVEELVRTWNNAVKATKQLEDQLADRDARRDANYRLLVEANARLSRLGMDAQAVCDRPAMDTLKRLQATLNVLAGRPGDDRGGGDAEGGEGAGGMTLICQGCGRPRDLVNHPLCETCRDAARVRAGKERGDG